MLPFETIPATPLREHFTRWLVRSLDGADEATRDAKAGAESKAGTGAEEAEPLTARPVPAPLNDASEPTRQGASPTRRKASRSSPNKTASALRQAASQSSAGNSAPPTSPSATTSIPPPALPGTSRGELIAAGDQRESAEGSTPPERRFVKRGDGSVWVTKPLLRSRGWTDTAVRDFLPEPEGLKPNPRFPASGAPMPVWRPATIAAAEAGPEWQDWLERSLRRRKTTLEALAETDDADFAVRLAAANSAISAGGEA
ncbi:hypothetical protein [Glycomyces sp. NRRL B-16210]|uniref:hypothetical protein n=1 Tax=Glycomyces sp. NRRL B-16210 TaxID=1463821 RepID=UPI00105D989E|nr:hypothetical protein [Glycomyces sp. NRRL B-16210]